MGSFLSINYASTYWTSNNPVLPSGEMGLETDTGKFKIGDGATTWNSLSYGFPPSVTYDSVAQQIDAQAFEDHADCVIPEGGFQVNDTMVVSSTNPLTWTGAHTGNAGSGNFAQAMVDFGFDSAQEGDVAEATVAAPWVTPTSIILCNPAAVPTVDHDEQDAQIEGLVAYAGNLVPGVSFDVLVYAPQGTWGKYLINAQGA